MLARSRFRRQGIRRARSVRRTWGRCWWRTALGFECVGGKYQGRLAVSLKVQVGVVVGGASVVMGALTGVSARHGARADRESWDHGIKEP